MDENIDKPETWFAPAGRAPLELLQKEHLKVVNSSHLEELLNAMPDFMMVLNKERQIVHVNRRLLQAFGVENPDSLTGLRPGEAAGCIHFKEGPDGCGTAKNCAMCGAVLAIMASQETGLPEERECQMLIDSNGCKALDLDVLATPITIDDELFTVLALRDISSEKRRYVMERAFFHDILNSAGGIRGLASLLQEGAPPDTENEYKNWLVDLSDNLIEEIQYQKRLLDAERGDYKPEFEPVKLEDLLHDLKHLYENHERAPGRKVELVETDHCVIETDPSLLRRIIGNMLINGLEASKPGDTIYIKGICQGDKAVISVTNPGEIPLEVQLQLFNRSFSTKAKQGRGLGTYSMKLFGERYLKGKVCFKSENGVTSFIIELPLKHDKNEDNS